MSLLEDRILRIIELRRSGKDDAQIAADLGIKESMVVEYEQIVQKTISAAIHEGHRSMADIAQRTGMSPVVIELCGRQYTTKLAQGLLRHSISYGERIAAIRQCVAEGKRSAEEIAEIVGLAATTVYQYARNVNLTEVQICAGKKRWELLQELLAQGETNLETLCEKLHTTPLGIRIIAERYDVSLPANLHLLVKKSKGEILKELLAQGETNLETLCGKIHTTPQGIRMMAKRYDVALPANLHLLAKKSKGETLKELLEQGETDLDILCAKIKTNPRGISSIAGMYGVELPEPLFERLVKDGVRNPQQPSPQAALLRQLVGDGETSLDTLCMKMDATPRTVKLIAAKSNIALPEQVIAGLSTREARREKSEILKELLAAGETSLDVICRRTGYTPKGLQISQGHTKIAFPAALEEEIGRTRILRAKRRPEYDKGIALGLPLEEIAKQNNCKRQNIDIYIRRTGQHEFYRQQRKIIGNKSQKEDMVTGKVFQKHYLYQLEEHIALLCKKKGFAYEKAWEYYNRNRMVEISFPTLVSLFEGYEYAQQRGVRLSLTEFAQTTGISQNGIGQIFLKVGLEPLYGKRDMPSRKKTAEKKERILRCFSGPLSSQDISYFSGIPAHSVLQYMLQQGHRRPSTAGIKRFHGGSFSGKQKGVLTYHLASKIYEASDAEFTPEEIQEYAGTKPELVQYALEHRKEIEPVIVNVLEQLYPGESFEKGYRNRYGIR